MGYIGKDIIHYGCGLELDPVESWKKISHAARKNVKKAESLGVEVVRKSGTATELNELRNIWYLPTDPNFPCILTKNDFLYMAYLQGELIGGVILLPVGQHLFLNNLTATEKGKECQVQSYLLWHAVNDLAKSQYKYIDVGVSYRPNLYRFFKNWATFHYPVIMNPPQVLPQIRLKPFQRLGELPSAEIKPEAIDQFCLKRPYTIVPTKEYAFEILNKLNKPFTENLFPEHHQNEIQIVDLTNIYPIQYGALIIGLTVSEQELWSKFGCFDFVKTEYIKKVLSHPENEIEKIRSQRQQMFSKLQNVFTNEDIGLRFQNQGFNFKPERAEKLNSTFKKFGIECLISGETLTLPCHQNLTDAEIEYIYAVYRGYLNLCSEWTPTQVKGKLKEA